MYLRNLSDDTVQRVLCQMVVSLLDEIFNDYDFFHLFLGEGRENDEVYFNLEIKSF